MDGKYLVGPHQITFDITNKCNLRCLHCYNSSGENEYIRDELSDMEVLDFIDEFKNVKLLNFCFCGGEPLLRSELIIKSIEKLKSYGCENIAMVTNGFYVTKALLDDLIDSGLTRIQVSLDGFKAESHNYIRNNKDAFHYSMNAIELISNTNIESSIAFTPTRYNIKELPMVKESIAKLGLKSTLRVQPVMIMGRAAKNILDIVPTKMQYRDLVREINFLNAEAGDIKIEWGDPIDHLIRFTKRNLLITNSVIRCNGDIVADPYIPVVLGNIRRHKFMDYWNKGLYDIWNNKIIQEFSKTILTTEDMDITKNKNIPDEFKNEDLRIDLIDDSIEKISDLLNSFNKN